jgi:hypothetical protein
MLHVALCTSKATILGIKAHLIGDLACGPVPKSLPSPPRPTVLTTKLDSNGLSSGGQGPATVAVSGRAICCLTCQSLTPRPAPARARCVRTLGFPRTVRQDPIP